jgi:hypothetical protein
MYWNRIGCHWYVIIKCQWYGVKLSPMTCHVCLLAFYWLINLDFLQWSSYNVSRELIPPLSFCWAKKPGHFRCKIYMNGTRLFYGRPRFNWGLSDWIWLTQYENNLVVTYDIMGWCLRQKEFDYDVLIIMWNWKSAIHPEGNLYMLRSL